LHLLQIAPRRFKNWIDDQGGVTFRVRQQAGAGGGLFFAELKTAEAWTVQDASRPAVRDTAGARGVIRMGAARWLNPPRQVSPPLPQQSFKCTSLENSNRLTSGRLLCVCANRPCLWPPGSRGQY
jgi:hypothetical protein